LVGRRLHRDGRVHGGAERSYDGDGDLYDSDSDDVSARGAIERDGIGDGNEQPGGN
jgi:hypothetical protein